MRKELIKYPVKYDPFGQYIFDADDNMIAEIRGFGRLQSGEEQDEMGRFIADAINIQLSPSK